MVVDPFRVANSEAVSEFCKGIDHENWSAFSVDIDMFYSLPHNQLLTSVRACIEANGELGFRNASGLSVESFLELLLLYLNSMVVGWRDGFYLQKTGVCIGSCVAPILSDIFLGEVDSAVAGALEATSVRKVLCYVDDFLVVYERTDEANIRNDVLAVFENCGGGTQIFV